MRVFGISLWTIILLGAAFYIGAKNPDILGRIPVLNRF